MMQSNFGNRLRIARREAGYSQDDLIEKINNIVDDKDNEISQATLSAWERGKRTPAARKMGPLNQICQILDINFDEIKNLLGIKYDFNLTHINQQYASDVKKWIENNEGKEIWFIAPENLPIFTDYNKVIAPLWKTNITNGIHYHLIFVREELPDKEIFRKIANQLEEINKMFAQEGPTKVKGGFHIYYISRSSILGDPGIIDLRKYDQAYKQMGAQLRAFKKTPYELQINEKISINLDDQKTFEDDITIQNGLLQWTCLSQSRIAVYIGRNSQTACLHWEDARRRLASKAESGYLWLSEKDSKRLSLFTSELKEWIAEKNVCKLPRQANSS